MMKWRWASQAVEGGPSLSPPFLCCRLDCRAVVAGAAVRLVP